MLYAIVSYIHPTTQKLMEDKVSGKTTTEVRAAADKLVGDSLTYALEFRAEAHPNWESRKWWMDRANHPIAAPSISEDSGIWSTANV